MDPRLVQRSRYLLQARVRRAKSCPTTLFGTSCGHLLTWLRNHPIWAPIVAELTTGSAQFAEVLEERESGISNDVHFADTLAEHAALSLAVIERVSTALARKRDEHDVVREMATFITRHSWNNDESIKILRDVAIDGLYEWLDEKIDARSAVLGLLLKYKHRCEWFRRKRLQLIAAKGLEQRQRGELSLVIDLQEYVFDQGVEFTIEPISASGRVDLVLRDTDGSHVALDAKYLRKGSRPSDFKRKLADGFHQVASYCHDFNEAAGYLVVFIEDTKTPRLPLQTADGFEFLNVTGKMVYYVPIIIADAPSASKAGAAHEVIIDVSDLVYTSGRRRKTR